MESNFKKSRTHPKMHELLPKLNDEETIKAIHHALNPVYEKYDKNKVTFNWLEKEKFTTKTLFFKCVFFLTGFLNTGKTYVWRSWRSFNNFSQ